MREGELPKGWEERYLGDIAEVFNGKTPSKSEQRDSGYPVLKIKDVDKKGDFIGNFDSFVDEDFYKSYSNKKIKKNDTLILNAAHSSSHVGSKSYYASELVENSIATGEWLIIRGDIDSIIPKYIYYTISHPFIKKQIKSIVKGIHLYPKNVAKVKIPLPPLETQKKIVAILEKAEQIQRLQAEVDKHFDDLIKSIFIDMFGDPVTNPKGWDVKLLEEICLEIIDCPHSTPIFSENETAYPCIRTSELKKGYIDWSSMKYLINDNYKIRIQRLKPEAGDIIYGREGTFGEAIIVPPNINLCLGQRVMLFRPNFDYCNSKYLWSVIRSDGVYHQALQKTSGSTVGHVNVKHIKRFKIIIPPLQLQRKYERIISHLEILLKLNKNQEENEFSCYNSLIQKAFKGELVK